MKKIGILTLPLVDNYGGMLQAVALHGYLKDRGYEVVSIHHRRVRYPDSSWKRTIATFLQFVPLQNIKKIRYEYKKINSNRSFLNKNLNRRTELIWTRSDLAKAVDREKFDAFVVGSDQVWRWDYIVHDWSRYFLDFIDSGKARKIAYAASFGKDYWQNDEVRSEVVRLLSDFHAVSTRESSGVKTCNQLGRSDCAHVLDPTLLVGPSFYDRFMLSFGEVSQSKTLLTYILDGASTKEGMVSAAFRMLGPKYELNNLGVSSDSSVEEWVRAFKCAEYIITDSFHGMVFGILFNKNFIVFGNERRGLSRFQSLLEQLGLSDRLVMEGHISEADFLSILNSPVDFERVNLLLDGLRAASEKFLLDAIEK